MQIVKVKPNTIFLIETEGSLPDSQKKEIMEEWNKMLPNSNLLLLKKGALILLEIDNDQN